METQVLAVLLIFCTLFPNTGNLYCRAAHNGSEVNIGVLLNYNSWVGKVAKTALEIAEDDINNDTHLLNGSRLVLLFRDTRGDAILGASAALDLFGKEVVAIIGPQASEVAEFILHLGDAAKVPIVSFSVTSPLVSNYRFPYFVRMAHSDALQMKPIAALAQAYGWRRVTAVYSDDELRSGAVAALSDALRDIGSELEYRLGRLQIGVPIKEGFNEFVKVAFDGNRSVTGFCIDVFEAVVKRLDYALPYDLIPYGPGNHTPSYDDLVYQVHLKKFDAVVGDITILANRSRYVDFTQPYTESGLVMVVPVNADEANNAWAFMLPFTPGMWCTTGAFFIFTGFVIWLFEHRVNPEFRGKPKDQVATLLWFSFSTMVFSQREKLVSSFSRLVLVIWLFIVLILTSSYTASLTSILTVQRLNPAVKDVESLRRSRAPVGYQEGTFVGEYLRDHLQIANGNLRTFSTAEEAGEILSNGTVAAIFDEIPYIRMFLSSQCGYTMVGPIYKTGGFGIAFRKDYPQFFDISRAVLNLSEDTEMQQIQNKWLNNTACIDSGAKVGSNRLSMASFWGLYLITGSVSVVALITFFSRLLCNYMRDPNVKDNNNSELGDPSTGKSLKKAMKSFMAYVDQKESSASSPGTRVLEISPSQRNSQFSPANFTSCPSAPGARPFSLSTLSRRSFSVVDDDHVVDVDVARGSSVSAPDHITEELPLNTRR